jgi:hypothetical protein
MAAGWQAAVAGGGGMSVGVVIGEGRGDGATVEGDRGVDVEGGDADPSWQDVRDRGASANRAMKTVRTIRALVIVVSS